MNGRELSTPGPWPGADVVSGARSGTVVEWNAAKAFGYLECEGKRVFLHMIPGGMLSRKVLSMVQAAAAA